MKLWCNLKTWVKGRSWLLKVALAVSANGNDDLQTLIHHTILVFLYQMVWQYSDGRPLTGVSNTCCMKKSRFFTNNLLYLRNDTRHSHSYYRRWIGNCTQAFKFYQFQWFWVTSNPDFKVIYPQALTKEQVTGKEHLAGGSRWQGHLTGGKWPTFGVT